MATGKQWSEEIESLNILQKKLFLESLDNLFEWKMWQLEMRWTTVLRIWLNKSIEKEEKEHAEKERLNQEE